MQRLRGELHIDDKLSKEMFLKRLPADVQTILASGPEDLSVSWLVETTVRMLEVQQFQPPSVAQLSISALSTPSEQIATESDAMAEEMASLKFESALLQTLLNFLGCTRIRTTAYHSAANGIVGRFNRRLKTDLCASEDPGNWSDNLPLHSSAFVPL
nr:unnamed protein product [Spirometra erinaceieuropaei]